MFQSLCHTSRFLILLIAVLGILWISSTCASADRDIVYSARYYLKPGSKGKSHFHLYRINPDGTGRKQITFGDSDDDNPQWSPDGKWILLQRSRNDYVDSKFCLIRPDGSGIRVLYRDNKQNAYSLYWTPHPGFIMVDRNYSADFHQDAYGNSVPGYQAHAIDIVDIVSGSFKHYNGINAIAWTPKGSRYATIRDDNRCEIYEWPSGKSLAKISSISQPSWSDENTLVGMETVNSPRALMCYSVASGVTRRISLVATDQQSREAIEGGLYGVQSFPPQPNTVLIHNFGMEEVRTNSYYKVDLNSGKTVHFTISENISWSPDGKWFCTTPYPETAEFDKKRNGEWRLVYVSPLQIGSTRDGKLHSIVHGMVSVMTCDWRKNGKDVH